MPLLNGLARKLNRRLRDRDASPESDDLLSDDMSDSFVKRVLDTRDAIPERSRVRAGMIHLSSLIDICPRQYALAVQHEVDIRSAVTGAHKVMWKVGRAVESHVRNEFIEGCNYRTVVGTWRCMCGQQTHNGLAPLNAVPCTRCGVHPMIYDELTLVDQSYQICGNPDLLFYHRGKLYVVEIKSMVAHQFDSLTSPLGNHVFQASGYRRLAEINGFEVAPEVILLYTRKDFKYGSPYKQFNVNVDRTNYDRILDAAWESAELVKDSVDNGYIPERTLCSSATCSRAKKCPVVAKCFI